MGGKNVIMSWTMRISSWRVEGCLWGGFGTTDSGAPPPAGSSFTSACTKRSSSGSLLAARRARGRRPRPRSTQVGPLVSEAQLETVIEVRRHRQIRRARARGWRTRPRPSGPYARGWFHEPTIFADVSPSMRIAQEEIFGPVVSMMRCRSFEEADRDRQRCRVWLVGVDLHSRHQPGVCGDARSVHRNLLRERADDWCRGPPAVWRHEGDRQRPSRSRHCGAGRLFRMEVGLRGLQRPAAARADRQPVNPKSQIRKPKSHVQNGCRSELRIRV